MGAERKERRCQEGGEEQSRGGKEEQQVKVKVRDTEQVEHIEPIEPIEHRTYRI